MTTDNTSIAEEQVTAPKLTREEVMDIALIVARNTNLVPTLLGPTASGKTYGWAQRAKENNAEVITVLLGQHTPDEIAGFQLVINNHLEIQMPFWFRHAQEVLDSGKSVWLIFDELGLAPEETRGALYTFFRDRRLHNVGLHSNTGQEALVLAATNPSTFAPPFLSRCFFVSVPSDRQYLKTIAGNSRFVNTIVDLAPINDESDPFYSNAEPPEPVVINAASVAALTSLTSKSEFWRLPEHCRFAILRGLVPAQTLISVLKNGTALDNMMHLASDYAELTRALNTLPTDQVLTTITSVVQSLPLVPVEKRPYVFAAIFKRLYADTTGYMLETYFSHEYGTDVSSAVSEIDPELMSRVFIEEGLINIKENSRGHDVTGFIPDQLKAIAEYQQLKAIAEYQATHATS